MKISLAFPVVLLAATLVGCSTSAPEPDAKPGVLHHTALLSPPSDERFIPAWELARFASAGTSRPRFADHVEFIVNGKRKILTREEAEDARTWRRTPVNLDREASWYLRHDRGKPIEAPLRMHTDQGQQFACDGRELPAPFSQRESLFLGLTPGGEGLVMECDFVNVFVTADEIYAVVVRSTPRFFCPRARTLETLAQLRRAATNDTIFVPTSERPTKLRMCGGDPVLMYGPITVTFEDWSNVNVPSAFASFARASGGHAHVRKISGRLAFVQQGDDVEGLRSAVYIVEKGTAIKMLAEADVPVRRMVELAKSIDFDGTIPWARPYFRLEN